MIVSENHLQANFLDMNVIEALKLPITKRVDFILNSLI